ncbi:MAG: FAD-dependent oxidoreductase [Desulfurococcaceae archaeon]|nr:FAD-dependent oxidoreductase [Desulfurococcaceae archaeon]
MRFAFMCRDRGGRRGSVAIIGAGPAGLAAAGYLTCMGYEVDVYDKLPYVGGLMMFAIPSYRIYPDNVIEGVEDLRDRLSVRFYLRTKVFAKNQSRHDEGDEFVEKVVNLEDLVEKYNAVLISTGTWSSRKLGVEGEDSRNVLTALEYLYHWRLYEEGLATEKPPTGRNVVVVGAGLSAIDAAEKALETGADVYIVYRRTIAEAPAGIYPINELIKRGVRFVELVQPTKIISEGGYARGLELVKMKLGEPDETGRPRPIPVPGTEFVMEADLVILAVGEIPTPPFVDKFMNISIDRSRRIQVNNRYQTALEKVFAAGDVVTGPSFIGKAFGSGLRAAKYIDSYLYLRR